MLTREEFYNRFSKSDLFLGQTYEDIIKQGQLMCAALGIPYCIHKDNTPVPRTSTNTTGTGGLDDNEEFTHRTIIVPGGLLTMDSSLFIQGYLRGSGVNNSKTLTVRINGVSAGTLNFTTNVGNQFGFFFHADRALNDQKFVNSVGGGFNSSAGGVLDTAHDASKDLTITINSNWAGAVSGETLTLETSMVWYFPG